MNYKNRNSGQAALEYMLLLTVAAIVVFLSLKPSTSGTPSVLNRAQEKSEVYYNTVTEAIMGRDPQPINGGWCAPKPSGQRECACPQPAFGGAPCVAPSGSIAYCGDGICNNGETGEPGHPSGPSDTSFTCFADCDFLSNCSLCANMVPAASCGGPCPTVNCAGLEVCMSSDCSPGCTGFTQLCQQDATLCSGACTCTGTWNPAGACGTPVGSCNPSPNERCFTNSSCDSSCTPAQITQARFDGTCLQCAAANFPIPCGPGTINIPVTLDGQTASVACPAGCAPFNTSSTCAGGTLSTPAPQCIPTVCLAQPYVTGVCGPVTLPITSPGGSTPVITCPPGCSGSVQATCGTDGVFTISNGCIPLPCPATPVTTNYCGPTTLPAVVHGVTSTIPCPGACSGSYSATCDRGNYVSNNDQCFANCPALPVSAGSCGSDSLPATTHGAVSLIPCPGGCSGSLSATCSNGTFGPVSNTCGCPSTPVVTGSCGTATLPPAGNGAPGSVACPGGCAGTVTGTCNGGTYTGINNTCQLPCPATPVTGGSCGSTTLPGVGHGAPSSVACPGGCSGNLSATCSNGSFGPVTNSCGCPGTAVNTGTCGFAALPAAGNGAVSTVGCPGGCTGTGVSATCVSGNFTGTSVNCVLTCPATVVGTAFCGNVTLPAANNGNVSSVGCPGGCVGSGVSATCSGGAFVGISDGCTPVYFLNFTVAAYLGGNTVNNQSNTYCYATVINSASVSGIGCGSPGTPSAFCTATLQ